MSAVLVLRAKAKSGLSVECSSARVRAKRRLERNEMLGERPQTDRSPASVDFVGIFDRPGRQRCVVCADHDLCAEALGSSLAHVDAVFEGGEMRCRGITEFDRNLKMLNGTALQIKIADHDESPGRSFSIDTDHTNAGPHLKIVEEFPHSIGITRSHCGNAGVIDRSEGRRKRTARTL